MSFERAYVFCGLCKHYADSGEKQLRDVTRNNAMSALESVELRHPEAETGDKAGIILGLCMLCKYTGKITEILDRYKEGHDGYLPGRSKYAVKKEMEEEEPMTDTQIIRVAGKLLEAIGEPEKSMGCTEIRKRVMENGENEPENPFAEKLES